ncbi:DEAD/DEAH box helicase [Paenibacillus turpanensis]|uniref:DEAD/DEAH box helicase n=1 Tax=Paenibacillus turpanensis TaxID=2689078 RepID=UPI00140E6D83|nr:DEAD/DEAH box helicase [Paenibacillus turpanensis]
MFNIIPIFAEVNGVYELYGEWSDGRHQDSRLYFLVWARMESGTEEEGRTMPIDALYELLEHTVPEEERSILRQMFHASEEGTRLQAELCPEFAGPLCRCLLSIGRNHAAAISADVKPAESWQRCARLAERALLIVQSGAYLPGMRNDGKRWTPAWVTENLAGDQPLVRDRTAAEIETVADLEILHSLVDAFVKGLVSERLKTVVLQEVNPSYVVPLTPIEHWLSVILSSEQPHEQSLEAIEWIAEEWVDWAQSRFEAARQEDLQTWLRLEPSEEESRPWTLSYFIGEKGSPDKLTPARQVWLEGASPNGDAKAQRLLEDLVAAADRSPEIASSLKEAAPERCRLSVERAYMFLKETAGELSEAGIGVLVPSWWKRPEPVGLRMTVQDDRPEEGTAAGGAMPSLLGFDALVRYRFELYYEGEAVPDEVAADWIKRKEGLVTWNGRWLELTPQRAEQLSRWLSERKDGRMSTADALHHALASEGGQQAEDRLPVIHTAAEGSFARMLTILRESFEIAELQPPPSLHGSLREYQLRGYSWLAAMLTHGFGVCLADDMGLGKTIQWIALLLHLKEQGELDGPVLLLCPTSVIGNWERELQRFAPSIRVLLHYGPERALNHQQLQELMDDHDVVITSYTTAQRDEELLAPITWGMAAFDEAQQLKNSAAKQTRAAKRLRAAKRVALTGTPVENRLSELWSIMDLVNPGYLGSYERFQASFAAPIERGGSTEAQQRLQKILRPFLLRRHKEDPDVAPDLPDKLEHKQYCQLTQEQAELYEGVVDQMLLRVTESDGMKRRSLILSSITKLKQLCNDPAHFRRETELTLGRSGKLLRLTELLDQIVEADERVIVFTQYAYMAKLLVRFLTERYREEPLLLHGGVPKAKRDELVRVFQEEADGPHIFVLSLKTGGFGLNLTRANHVIHYDRWWNPAVENQATDRVHRIGQREHVQVHKLITAGTLEEQIDLLMERKKELSEGVIGSGEQWLTELSSEQLKDILMLREEHVGGQS